MIFVAPVRTITYFYKQNKIQPAVAIEIAIFPSDSISFIFTY